MKVEIEYVEQGSASYFTLVYNGVQVKGVTHEVELSTEEVLGFLHHKWNPEMELLSDIVLTLNE